jgi:hypothetical protein
MYQDRQKNNATACVLTHYRKLDVYVYPLNRIGYYIYHLS